MESLELVTIMTVAFLGSIGHCSGMCGGFVVAYGAAKVDPRLKEWRKLSLHLLYNLGRISSYIVIGALFGFLGSMIVFSQLMQGSLYALIASLMILIGISMIGKIGFLTWLESQNPLTSRLHNVIRYLIKSPSPASFYLLGIANGFLPCGFVYLFAITAASTASALEGAAVMALFGAATLPVMLAMGYFTSLIQKVAFRVFVYKVAGWIVIGFGFYMSYKAYLFLFTEGPKCH